jgi:ElaB/YqjD/DUF883 family membrane-anchored ribosome-binding protein
MGILSSIFGSRTQVTPTGEYVPSSQADTALTRTGDAIMNRAGPMLNRAGEFYRQNPKKVQAVGLVAAAALLASLSRGRR